MPMRPGCGWPGGCTGCTWRPARCSPCWSAIPSGARRASTPRGCCPGSPAPLVHDAFAPYARYRSATHALCNAHLLRELIAVVDFQTVHPPAGADTPAGWCWATQVIDALLALKAITDTGVLPSPEALTVHRRLI